MHNPTLDEYHRELRNAFFQQRDQVLLDFLNAPDESSSAEDPLQFLTGVEEPQVMAALRQVGITAESMAAFTLLPLVRVAWADAQVQDNEFDAILQAEGNAERQAIDV